MGTIHLEHMDVVSELMCNCGGKMKSDGIPLESLPVQYKHVCVLCGEVEYNVKQYPNIDYINVFREVKGVYYD